MEQRALGRSGLIVSRLGLGTMTWGRDTDEDEAAMQLTAFVDAGGTLVDTADVYCDGESERTLGRLLSDVVPRADVLIATRRRSRKVVSILSWNSRPRAMIGMLPRMTSQPIRASGSDLRPRSNSEANQAPMIRAMSRAK